MKLGDYAQIKYDFTRTEAGVIRAERVRSRVGVTELELLCQLDG